MKPSIVGIVVSTIFLGAILELLRRRRMHEQHSLLWLVLGGLMLALSVFTGVLDWLARIAEVAYAPSLLFVFGLLFSFLFILRLTILVSKCNQDLARLTQEIGLLSEVLARSRASHEPPAGGQNG